MSNKGYGFEAEIENFFLAFTNQNKHDPILCSDKFGVIRVNRSFRIPSSGAMDSLAGDVITYLPWLPYQLKVECKARFESNKKDGQIFILEKEWLDKNNIEAIKDNQISILMFSFKKTQKNRIWCIILHRELEKLYKNQVPLIPLEFKNVKRIKLIKAHLDINYKENIMFSLQIVDDLYYLFPLNTLKEIIMRLKVQ